MHRITSFARALYRRAEMSESRLRATLDTAVDGIVTTDAIGTIVGFNPAAERLFGWDSAEITGRNIKEVMPSRDQIMQLREQQHGLIARAQEYVGSSSEILGRRRDGSLVPLRLALGRMQLHDEMLYVGFVSDISERRAMESSLREAAAQAERAAAAKSTFLANMSHEIRTPMNAIIGFTELLLQSDLTTTQRNHLSTVRQSSRSLLGLINDILDTTRLEKGGMVLEMIDFSLKGISMQIESSLRLSAQARGLSLTTSYPANLPEYFLGDPLRILQVLTNLVGNAIKFTERGGVELSFSSEDEQVIIMVRDTGIGMTQEQVASIFTPFTQADASISRRFGGTGLGTTISRQLVELMDGQIEVESALGQGSCFRVRLPLAPGKCPTGRENVAPNRVLPPLRILVADDVAQNVELLSLILTEGGHTLETARDGAEAVARFHASRFDVVLMDVHMPGTDGLEATRLIRQHERTTGAPQTPIIALTASVLVEDRRAARQAGMSGFAVKPLELANLLDEIARVLAIPVQAPDALLTPATRSAVGGHTSLIDWTSGVAVWGNKQRLAKSLDQFLRTTGAPTQLPDAQSEMPTADALGFHLHALRGAAANLAVPSVASQAGEMETRLRLNADVLHTEHFRRDLEALRSTLSAVREELDASGQLASDADPPPTSESTPPRELGTHVSALSALLTRSELDDELLDAVCGGWEAGGDRQRAQRLRQAVDAFDFGAAVAVLDTWTDDAADDAAGMIF